MKYDITSIDDIERIQDAILNNEEVEIGDIKPIHFKIKLSGGRFENYNPKLVDKFVAQAILSQQANYEKFLKEIEKRFHVRISPEAKLLKFELQSGSLELLTDMIALMEVFENMESIHQLYTMLGVAGGWFTYLGFGRYMEIKKEEIQLKSQEKSKELSGKEQEKYLDTINKAFDSITEIANNAVIQKAINKPKQDIANMLQDGESFALNNDSIHNLTHDSAPLFEYAPPVVNDIEEEVDGIYAISNYFFKSEEKLFKIDGISENASSLAMPAAKRMKMITKAELLQSVHLKLKIIKDGLSGKIKKVLILDYIE